jgi:uncharacterized phage protein (TIGR02220 family)
MSRLLIQENPIFILPSLAKKVGINEAIVLQQIHYWLGISRYEREGRKWIYNSYKDWQIQMPFWSEKTIKRTIRSLEDKGYLRTANFYKLKMDKTKWYSIDYDKMTELEEIVQDKVTPSIGEVDPHDRTKCPVEVDKLTPPLPEINTENNSERKDTSLPVSEIITYLNEQCNSTYRASSRKTKEFIQARWNEGFRLDDFKRVIDIKADEWRNDPFWSKYLRPETIFGPKFESYLNQKGGKKVYKEEDFNLDD